MPSQKVSWLSHRAVNYTINEYRGCTKGPYEEQVVLYAEIIALKKSENPNPNKGPKESPDMFFNVDQRFLIENVFRRSDVTLNALLHTGAKIRYSKINRHTKKISGCYRYCDNPKCCRTIFLPEKAALTPSFFRIQPLQNFAVNGILVVV